MGMARAEGQQTIGQEEYEFQLQKHSIGKQINALARNIAILLMGPEPLQGATALNVGDIPETDGQFFVEPNANQFQHQGFSWMFIFMCSLIVLALAGLLWWIYKRADDAFKSFEPLYTDVAMMESALHTLQQQVRRLRSAQAELSEGIEMVSD